MQGGFRPGLEPVNHSGVDGGQEALTTHTEVGSYRTGCEHHVQIVAHLHDTYSFHDAWADAEHALPAAVYYQPHSNLTGITNLTVSSSDSGHVCLAVWLADACLD